MTSKEKKPIVRCPLCGATLDGHTLILQASEQMVDSKLGVLGGTLPVLSRAA